MADPIAEVRRLHDVIEEWFTGSIAELAPFSEALAEEFHIVSPSGTTRSKSEVVEGMTGARGRFADESPPFELRIENATVRVDEGDRWLVTYEEHQRIDGAWEARTSSVLLRESPDTPAGVEWVHLHETWLSEGS